MKTKLFFAAMAAVAVVGCQKEPAGSLVSDGDATFLKVDLRAAGTLTRAAVGTFEYGEANENAVSSVDFYFFDASGNAYPVDNSQNNYVTADTDVKWSTEKGDPYPNVASISDAVLVIKQSKQAPPAQIVVVLNATEKFGGKNLSALHDAIKYLTTETEGTDYFVMSNSVYYDGSAVVDATSIMSENIFAANEFTDKDGNAIEVGSVLPDAKIYVDGEAVSVDPVDIYVERVAAKVRVYGAENLISVKDENDAEAVAKFGGKDVYAKVLGWQVTNNTDEAPLLKNIEATWIDNALGFAWNAPAYFRSYWAATTAEPKHNFTFSDIAGKEGVDPHNPVYDYYFENTAAYVDGNGVDVDDKNSFENALGSATTVNQAPQLLIAAQLVDADGNPLQIAKWYGVQYTIDDLKTAMVATVASKIYVKDGEDYRTIGVDDVEFYQVPQTTADNRYEVRVRPVTGKDYYDSSTAETTVAETTAAAKALLEGIAPAQMWTDGYAYYYTTIKHFGAEGTTGEYGLVRNHVYDIKIEGVTGFGTPVYDPEAIITPEKPEDDVALNLSARINILSWHLVSQNVTLE